MRGALANESREAHSGEKGQEKNWVSMWSVDMKDRRYAESHRQGGRTVSQEEEGDAEVGRCPP